MADLRELIDQRALSMRDVPFSAYCKVCWQNVYCMWVDDEPHDGSCPFGAEKISDCKQALDWERCMGEIKKHLAESRSQEGNKP